MSRTLKSLCLAAAIWAAPAQTWGLENTEPNSGGRIHIESKQVWPGTSSVHVGVYFDNFFELDVITLPLEFRSIDSGAYFAGYLNVILQGRIAASGLRDTTTHMRGVPDLSSQCSGPESHSFTSDVSIDFASPDLIYWTATTVDSPYAPLPQGSDGSPGTGSPSLVLEFGVTEAPGRFVIDTGCYWPNGHLDYASGSSQFITPTFEPGMVTISDSCVCACHGDLSCDSVVDALDVIRTIDEAFRTATPTIEESCPHVSRGDLNCDCGVDVVDVVLCINVAFRSQPFPACDPCTAPCR